jgi:thymidine phosphorylase
MTFLPAETIRRKRDGHPLDPAEIEAFVRYFTTDPNSDAQAAAFAMAVFFRGMQIGESAALTRAMMRSGEVLTWDLPGPVLDKHSTGGVGDTVSLMLGPAVAACGGYVPMISGRGLGHTGGTLDKFDSIPGYATAPDEATFRRVTRAAGCAIIGQTGDLAPADRKLYGIRDVTATVESIPLITASILSKKLAAGLEGLVMDVKVGSGAFMARAEDARALARSLAEVATSAGLPTTALLTDMNEPLASAAGNAVEVAYAIDYLTGVRREPRMHAIVVELGAEMLLRGGLAGDVAAGRAAMERAIAGGAAAERFARMVVGLGGPADILERPAAHLVSAPIARPVHADRAGFVSAIATREVGLAVVMLGGGRLKASDRVDHRVGLTALAGLGEAVGPDAPLAVIHAADEAGFDRAAAAVRAAYAIADAPISRGPLIAERFAA